ncbi:hypothetical protein RM780_01685 [Streptomyces sp. DSM 44917]|uniref:Uncharacterized protein n=1 Tax=Streptomyces boetiae TaxID=3075541 RepID=A0ABU2L294_9ACTN|nr:hypothetical protein [Streptomyces sp. DSM 44917]MDT0305675.1 hypothetical protein [Streptomyces sp. DSM 44917]
MTTDQDFQATIGKILSARHLSMRAASGAWLALAVTADRESGALSGSAAEASGQRGAGLLQLADRMEETSGWATGAGRVAREISRQLGRAGEQAARASENALRLQAEFDEVTDRTNGLLAVQDVGMAAVRATQRASEEKRALTDEARNLLETLGQAFAEVIGAEVPTAPASGGGGADAGGTALATAAAGTAGAGTAAATARTGGAARTGPGGPADRVPAPNGSRVGAGDYPGSSVLGPDQGDFAGWVRSPNTGFLVDPATGREFDPVTGRWIDPVTGQPFGEVTEYAARLAGLGSGPGALASGLGLTGGVAPAALAATGGAGSLAALYGGLVPPSVGHTGPARGQMVDQATRNLGQRARVATRFALHEAAQGGRPFTPPPGAAAHAAGRAAGGGAATAAGARARAAGERAATWGGRRADAAARHQLAGAARPAGPARPAAAPPAPGATRASRGEERRREGAPTDLTEDPAVWSPARRAGRGVLGD